MRINSSSINDAFAHISATAGHALWRTTLTEQRETYVRLSAQNQGAALWGTLLLRDGLRGACFVRAMFSRAGSLDRVAGTGWNRAAPPGAHAASMPRHTPDIERLDLGSLHKACASLLGASDLAVLVTHPPFFVLRMLRHAVVAGLTAVGFVPGLAFGAVYSVPKALFFSSPRAEVPDAPSASESAQRR